MAELLTKHEFRTRSRMRSRAARPRTPRSAWRGRNGELSREHFARWAENHYHYVGPFADYLGYIYANTPDHATDAKDFLLQNMYEEELSDVRHTDLLIRFAEACGTTRERVMDIDNMNAVTRGLQGWCYATAMREHFAVATAALVVGLESQVPTIYRRQYPPLLEKYGFTEEETEFFDLHITSDEIHGERGYQIVLDHADTPELQQRSLQLVRHGAEMRFSYTKALYDTYVAPDGPDGRRAAPSRRSPRHAAMPTIRFVTSDMRGRLPRGRRGQPPPRRHPQRLRGPLQVRERQLRHRPGAGARGRRELQPAPQARTRAPRGTARAGLPPGLPDLRQG